MKVFLVLVMAVLAMPPVAALAGGDSAAGAVVFKKCAACHTATEAKNKIGPSLMGVIGRPVATVADYKYSPAMTGFAAGKIWDEALLAEYLPKPQALVKGTKMAFVGLQKPEDIANIIAYLKDPASAK